MRLLILLSFIISSYTSIAQQKLNIRITGGENNNAVTATIFIKGIGKYHSSDSTGHASISFPSNGNYVLTITAIDHEEKELKISIPYSSDTLFIELEGSEEEMEEVIVQSTRTSRTIANVPTRIETIELEEIDEK